MALYRNRLHPAFLATFFLRGRGPQLEVTADALLTLARNDPKSCWPDAGGSPWLNADMLPLMAPDDEAPDDRARDDGPEGGHRLCIRKRIFIWAFESAS